MIKPKLLKAVLFLVILSITLFIIFFFFHKYKESGKSKGSQGSQSVFGTLLKGSSAPTSISTEGIEDIVNFIKDAGASGSTQSGSEVQPKVWDYKTSFMQGFIASKDVAKGTFTLWIPSPSDKIFSETDKEVRVNCTPDISVVVTPMNFNIIERDVNILEKAKPAVDGIMAFCLDENCDAIGRNCAIIQDFYNFAYEQQR
ncbi:hypothetical protein KKC62_01035 [Patescibacteria group bacterium]|nr:hypothetical protein [Patescibacteria group bacterium]MBU1952783.1 hypothetical protein [Patescibacteria group bacterium]